ncbi:hypothetical protein ABVB19_22065, partial [Xanthomonas citri pv. mangiferaeindicae]
LIERHVHVRRRFGTKFLHLREFDRFESRPEKANALIVRRKKLPTRPMGTYKSTELDTTERKIPWYYIALPIFLVAAVVMMYVAFGRMGNRLAGPSCAARRSVSDGARDCAGREGDDFCRIRQALFAAYPVRAVERTCIR